MALSDAERDLPLETHGRPATADGRGTEANGRLTGSLAAALLVLLAAEGLTLLEVRRLLSWHVFLGMVLIPPVLFKVGSTSYRFLRYYAGSPAYRAKGPPSPLLRLLGPFVVVLSLVLLGSGVALLLDASARGTLLFVHKASFVFWFGAMSIHVLGHVLETASLAPRDYYRRTRRQVAGAGLRQWSIAVSLVLGALLGVIVVGRVGPYLAG